MISQILLFLNIIDLFTMWLENEKFYATFDLNHLILSETDTNKMENFRTMNLRLQEL